MGGTTSAQVRKDLSAFGSFGKRGLGYAVPDLINAIRDILGLQKAWNVVIVGAGKIGAALAQFRGFNERSFNVVGIYDADPSKVGTRLGLVVVRDDDELERDIRELKPDIAVVCVPADSAQAVVDRLVAADIHAILNFASVPLQTPDNVTIRDVNMATELEILAFRLTSGAKGD